MKIAIVNYSGGRGLDDPDEWLDRCPTLVRWAEALLASGSSEVRVAQRFGRDADVERGGVRFAFRFRPNAIVRGWKPDLVHVNGLVFPMQAFLLRRLLPPATAMVLQDHGGTLRPRPSWRAGLRAADAIFFTASAQARSWRLHPGDPVVFEIPEAGCDLSPIPAPIARERSGLQGSPSLLCVGRLNAVKDPAAVVDGFHGAVKDLPAAHLTFVYSSDELLRELRQRVDASDSLRGRVTFRGAVPHDSIAAFFSAADLFVLGSRREGSGYALMEALACGTMPVVTDIPSFRAITLDGSLGVLWRPGYPRACAAAIVDAAERRSPSREAIRARFLAEHSWQAVGDKAMTAYAGIVSARRGRRAMASA